MARREHGLFASLVWKSPVFLLLLHWVLELASWWMRFDLWVLWDYISLCRQTAYYYSPLCEVLLLSSLGVLDIRR